MEENLEQIQQDIKRARKWARERFNAYVDEETTPSGLFSSPRMLITFPQPDVMHMRPVVYGKAMDLSTVAIFKLCWKGDELLWKGNFALRKALYGEGDIIEHEVPSSRSLAIRKNFENVFGGKNG